MALRTLDSLTPREFENLTFDLVRASGMKNVQWRTPGSDVGRDIEGTWTEVDFSGAHTVSRWYIDCKRYGSSIGWPTVWDKLAYADSQGADYLLIVTQSTATPQCLDQINLWNGANRRPQIRVWSRHEVLVRIKQAPSVAVAYSLHDAPSAPGAMAPLTQHLARMTIAASDSHSLTGNPRHYLDAASGLAQLIMSRTAQLNDIGETRRDAAATRSIAFPWLAHPPNIDLKNFDGPYLRALIPSLMVSKGSSTARLEQVDPYRLAIHFDDARRQVFPDLYDLMSQIDLWGNAETRLERDSAEIIARGR